LRLGFERTTSRRPSLYALPNYPATCTRMNFPSSERRSRSPAPRGGPLRSSDSSSGVPSLRSVLRDTICVNLGRSRNDLITFMLKAARDGGTSKTSRGTRSRLVCRRHRGIVRWVSTSMTICRTASPISSTTTAGPTGAWMRGRSRKGRGGSVLTQKSAKG
jgi:hypothetical protein